MQYDRFDQIEHGHAAQFEVTIDNEKMAFFLAMSGDTNALHNDNTYAISRNFDGRVVYGMLTASFYSTLIGVYLPGKHALFQGIDISFNRPVYIGDMLVVHGKVSHINEAYQQIEITAYIENHDKQKVSKAKIKVGFQ
jgi:3-hydroxybutyryl-CoA dehydratase